MKKHLGAHTIVVAGSSSGGHVTPINPVVRNLKKNDSKLKVIYFGVKGDRFSELIDDKLVNRKIKIHSGKLRWYHNEGLRQLLDIKTQLLNIRDIFLTFIGLIQADSYLARLRPKAIFIKGGSITVPLGLAAAFRRIPIVTHDSDSIPGRGSKIISKWVVVHTVGMDASKYGFPAEDTVEVGVPVEETFYGDTSQLLVDKVREENAISGDKKTILVVGGSQGAMKLNNIIEKSIEQLKKLGQIIHVVGGVDYEKFRQKEMSGYRVIEFIKREEVPAYFTMSDLIISRASATFVAEVIATNKPLIVIPGKQLSGGHQISNANFLAKKGAASVLDEDMVGNDNQEFISTVSKLLNNETEIEKMKDSQKKLQKPNTAKDIAQILIQTMRRHEEKR